MRGERGWERDLFLSKAFSSFLGRIERGEETMNKSRNGEMLREEQENNGKGGRCGGGGDEHKSCCRLLRVFASHSSRELRREIKRAQDCTLFRDRMSVITASVSALISRAVV